MCIRDRPAPGEIRLTVGALSAGAEYPQLNLAILTEGQLTAASSGKAPAKRSVKKDNRQKLLSYTDLTPGDLVVHAHHLSLIHIFQIVGLLPVYCWE